MLLLAVAFVACYSAANWLLFSDGGLAPLDQDLANLWLPLALGLILVATLIAPRLRVLDLNQKRNLPTRILLLYQVVAAAVLIVPACFAQHYVATASGTLTEVTSASAIPLAPRTQYYAADSVCIESGKPLIQQRNELAGKYNEYLVFNRYVLVPVCATSGQPAWIGLKYRLSIDNRITTPEKEAKYREFLNDSQEKFQAFDPAHIQYLESLGRNSDRRSYEKALQQKVGIAKNPSPIILIPHEESFEARNGKALSHMFWSFGITAGVFLLLLLFPYLNEEKVAWAQRPRSERTVDRASFWSAIDNLAHIGGFAAGIVSGVLIFWFAREEKLQPSSKRRQPSDRCKARQRAH
ncbi:MAG: hypothetical protein LBF16_09480 [Pseudomonadales bacterium]|nr:hypothetical protein [Pseudomonadales bacterium]